MERMRGQCLRTGTPFFSSVLFFIDFMVFGIFWETLPWQTSFMANASISVANLNSNSELILIGDALKYTILWVIQN